MKCIKNIKKSSSEPLGSGAGNWVCSMAKWSLTKFDPMVAPVYIKAPHQEVLDLNHRRGWCDGAGLTSSAGVSYKFG